jgi:hypothetical protein
MRYLIAVPILVFATLGFSMADDPNQQEKPKPKEIPLKAPYDERVEIKVWQTLAGGKKVFLSPYPGVPAYRKTAKDGTLMIYLSNAAGTNTHPTIGTELTDKDGVVWLVKKVQGMGPYVCDVEKKPEENKDDR